MWVFNSSTYPIIKKTRQSSHDCTRQSLYIIPYLMVFESILPFIHLSHRHTHNLFLCMFSLLPLVFTLTQPQPTHLSISNAKQERCEEYFDSLSHVASPSSVGLKPQSRQMQDTQRFMSSSDSATRYQVLSSVLRSKTKLLSSSFFVNDRPASTWRRWGYRQGKEADW